jgi:hypothetical protein
MITISRSIVIIISLATGLVLAGATAEGAAPAPAAGTKTWTNLVLNRGFERPVCPQNCLFSAGSTAIPHWTAGGDSVDIVPASYWQPAGGNQSVDLAGLAPGSRTQNVATAAGSQLVHGWQSRWAESEGHERVLEWYTNTFL